MQLSFIILFMIDLYKDNHVCVHLLTFSLKRTSQKLLTGLLPNLEKNFSEKNFSETIDWTFTKFHSSVP